MAFSVAALAAENALDKNSIMEHIRASYDFPAAVKLELGDPRDSEVAGFQRLEPKVSMRGMEQTESVYLSKDRRFYVLGGFKDARVHPYAERMAKMNQKGLAVRGKSEAPVLIAEYTDFQCPYCQKGYQIMRERIMNEYPAQVRWVYKSLPLKSMHPWAEPAAIAVECAQRQGDDRFWSLHDAIFEAQREITSANFEEKLQALAKTSKLDLAKFNACYDKKESLDEVQRDVKESEELGIRSTPTFLVNGRLIPGADYAGLKAAIEEFLKKEKQR